MAEQSTETSVADDLLTWFERVDAVGPRTRQWLVIQRLMRSERVVVVNVGRDEEVEVSLTEHDEMIEAFVADRFDPAFDECVLLHRQLHLIAMMRVALFG